MCDKYYLLEAKQYWVKAWEPRQCGQGQNKEFLNLCKIEMSTDTLLAAEIYAAEALTRSAVCMFYALIVSSAFAFAATISIGNRSLSEQGALPTGVWRGALAALYLLVAAVIPREYTVRTDQRGRNGFLCLLRPAR